MCGDHSCLVATRMCLVFCLFFSLFLFFGVCDNSLLPFGARVVCHHPGAVMVTEQATVKTSGYTTFINNNASVDGGDDPKQKYRFSDKYPNLSEGIRLYPYLSDTKGCDETPP